MIRRKSRGVRQEAWSTDEGSETRHGQEEWKSTAYRKIWGRKDIQAVIYTTVLEVMRTQWRVCDEDES
jgi:hypothetical protein